MRIGHNQGAKQLEDGNVEVLPKAGQWMTEIYAEELCGHGWRS